MSASSFANWLESLQARLGWSDTKLASEVGVSASTVSLWKNRGITPRSPKHLERLVDISGDDRGTVFGLAGRGSIGMDSGLPPEAIRWANDIYDILKSIDDDEIAEIALSQLEQGIFSVRDLIERLKDMKESSASRK